MTLADSDALRMRRSRRHRAGDHSLCRRCAAVRGGEVPSRGLAQVAQVPDAPPLDPAAELRDLASRLVLATQIEPGNAMLAAELRKTLVELIGGRAERTDDDLAGLFGALGSA